MAPKISSLPPNIAKWIKYLLGFSISVAVGLAPYLGRVNVPLFTPMLSFIPLSLQGTVIPLSSAAMGIVAVLVQWYSAHQVTDKWKTQIFRRSVVISTLSLFALLTIENFGVERVYVPSIRQYASFSVGFAYPRNPPCDTLSRAKCITEKLSLDQDTISTYFGEAQVKAAQLFLEVTYTIFMATFGIMIGLLVIAETS